MPPAQFKLWDEIQSWGTGKACLASLLNDMGATGKSPDGQFLLDVLCVHGFPQFAYVRLRSRHGEVDFTFPSPTRLSQLGALLDRWELDDLQWTGSQVFGVPHFQKTLWSFPRELATPTPVQTWFLTYENTTSQPQLNLRAGWATFFSKNNPQRQLITLMGPELSTLKKLLDVMHVSEPGRPFSDEQAKVAIATCLDIGADYFERKLLKPAPGRALSFVPHAKLINMNSMAMGLSL